MEPVGAFFDEEFHFLKMFTNGDTDFLLSDPAENLSQNFGLSPQAFFPEAINTNMISHNFWAQYFDTLNTNSYVSQESSNSSGSEIQVHFPNESYEDNQDNNVNSFLILNNDNMDFLSKDNQSENDNTTTLTSSSQGELKRKLESSAEPPKKKPRAQKDKNKRNNVGQAKKKKKAIEDNIKNTNEEKNDSSENAPTSCSMSEDGSNEANGEVITSECMDSSVPNSKGKTRATRGNATDPQSLYARKRRERINERLRMLQTLVPNGTKVDISTMLEEAVQYVKFLQLQIQLLSSDDMWMFAPLAFNGIDVGIYQGMFPNL